MLATAAADDGALPLKGLRVLDMTRVLAGVRCRDICCRRPTADGSAALLHTNPRRSRVR